MSSAAKMTAATVPKTAGSSPTGSGYSDSEIQHAIETSKSGAQSVAEGIGGDIVSAAEPYALKFGLYALFIIGGVAMLVYGLTLAIKPVAPGPNEALRSAPGKVARSGAEAVAA